MLEHILELANYYATIIFDVTTLLPNLSKKIGEATAPSPHFTIKRIFIISGSSGMFLVKHNVIRNNISPIEF